MNELKNWLSDFVGLWIPPPENGIHSWSTIGIVLGSVAGLALLLILFS